MDNSIINDTFQRVQMFVKGLKLYFVLGFNPIFSYYVIDILIGYI
jgi:hypothetical protein